MNVETPRPLYPGPKMWLCPECKRLSWACEDLGPNRSEHDGWALYRGERTPPKCSRHPGAIMALE